MLEVGADPSSRPGLLLRRRRAGAGIDTNAPRREWFELRRRPRVRLRPAHGLQRGPSGDLRRAGAHVLAVTLPRQRRARSPGERDQPVVAPAAGAALVVPSWYASD